MDETRTSSTSRIAIKLGSGSSNGTKPSPRHQTSSSLGKRQRPLHGLNDDSESGDDGRENGRRERLTTFGADGPGRKSSHRDRNHKTSALPAIERQPNRDWKSEVKRQRNTNRKSQVRPQNKENGSHKDVEPADEDKALKWGLTVNEKSNGEVEHRNGDVPAISHGAQKEASPDRGEENSLPAKQDGIDDADREAFDALLGRSNKPQRELVIDRASTPPTEGDVFREDFRNAPDESSLAEYDAMPVADFGAALLRGMGWDGKERGQKVKQAKRRANQLGLGAKELQGAEDLGAWNQKGNKKSRPRLHEYNREEGKRREKRDGRHHESYKQERDRERDSDRHGHRHRERHYHHR